MNPMVGLFLSSSVYLFVIAITIWALTAPYVEAVVSGMKFELYLTKQCVNGQCLEYKDDPNSKAFMQNGQALMALYIIFLILSTLCMVLYLSKQKTLCNYVGLLTLGIAVATMITLIVMVKTTQYGNIIKNFDFSAASILMIISCCFMIIKQVMANGIIRSVIKL